MNLPFLSDLHTEVEKEWKKPFSSRIHRFQHTSYANIIEMRKNGYERMPPVEDTLASYLSMGETASLKVPSLPSTPLQVTSCLNGRAYAAAGQVVASLHTMAVLQAYQADLLKDLDNGQGFSPDEVAELRHTTDLALRATKQAATAMGRSKELFSFGFQRRQPLFFTLPSSPFFLPACFFCLVSYLLKRLSLHGSPNWKIMDLINWSLSAIDTIFSRRSLGSGEPVCPDGTFGAGYTMARGRGGKLYVWRLFLWRTLRISTFSAP